ncbi:MAG: hypothetical protein AAFW46_06560 [Pseudomonadota bacterium]
MEALFAHAAKDLRLEPAPEDPLGPGQVRIAVRVAVRIAVRRGGICGADRSRSMKVQFEFAAPC